MPALCQVWDTVIELPGVAAASEVRVAPVSANSSQLAGLEDCRLVAAQKLPSLKTQIDQTNYPIMTNAPQCQVIE
jgi:hypothetical protein